MIVRNTVLNLFGLGAPLLFSLFCIPALISGIGLEKFGFLTLMWALVSYFGVLDLGIGRALTLRLAISEIGRNRSQSDQIISTALTIMAGMGCAIGLLIFALAKPLGSLYIEDARTDEIANSIYAMAAALPLVLITTGFRGILEARQRFGIVNAIRIPMGAATFLGPLLSLWMFGPRLDYIAWILTICRTFGALAHAYYSLEGRVPEYTFDRSELRRLLAVGGWLSVANAAGPLMNYADRFIIGGILSTAAVAFYATPQEIVTKLWIIPGALTAVLFPSFAVSTQAGQDRKTIFYTSIAALTAVLLPVCLAVAVLAEPILSRWIDASFASESAPVLSVMAVGIFINCLAHVPYTLLQSTGGARLTALIQISQLPFYLAGIWYMTTWHGVVGVAVIWTARIVVDTALLFIFAMPLVRTCRATP
nr:flippase [Rhizobium sp. Q54]